MSAGSSGEFVTIQIKSTPPVRQDRVSRRGTQGPSMFVRMLLRAALVRRGRMAGALIAITVAAAVATALLTLYGDTQSKLRADFRGYGANAIVLTPDGSRLPPDSMSVVQREAGPGADLVPYAYVVARTGDGLEGTPVVVAGTDFDRAKNLNTWWAVTHWPEGSNLSAATAENQKPQTRALETGALFGRRAAQSLGMSDAPIDLWFSGRKITVHPAGTLKTGGEEESRIYIDLTTFQSWTGVAPSAIEVRVPGTAEQVRAALARLQSALPGAQVRPVRQIVEAEARVLGRTRSMLFWTTLAVIGTSALCVLATLMSWVLDRRRDFAVMKALGASERLVLGFFATEAALVGGMGALVGFVLGIGAAEWIGQSSFGSSVTPQLNLMPLVIAGGIVLALAAAGGPLGVLRRIQPAAILRGE